MDARQSGVVTVGASGLDFVSNEPVQGELLTDRLAGDPPAPPEAFRIALGIGDALARAHAADKVHGCLCPATIALSGDRIHIMWPKPADRQAALPYRAPEQINSGQADWRSDIFAFGAILYELASGRRAFPGTGTELMEAILTRSPEALTAKTSFAAAMEGVIAGCLRKDPARRRQRMRNAVIELKLAHRSIPRAPALRKARPVPAETPAAEPANEAASQTSGQPPEAAARAGNWGAGSTDAGSLRRRLVVIGLAAVALAATGIAAALYLHKQAAPVLKFSVGAPEHTSYPGTPAVSPDGLYLTFSAVGPEGQRMLWLRAFDEMHAKVIPGTEGAFAPFWSPDSHYIAFFAHKSLMKVRIAGGSGDVKPELLATTEAQPGGGTWNQDGVIVFSPSLAGGLFRISSSGGQPAPVLAPDAGNGDLGYLWPQFLPDDKHFVYFSQTVKAETTTGVYVASLDEPGTSRLLFVSATNAVYSPIAGESASKGYLLYVKDRDLVGQPFNASKLATTGDPIVLSNDVGAIESLSLAPISVSRNDVLVYQIVGKATRQLVWMDRAGENIGTIGEGADWLSQRIAPDGVRVAAGKLGQDGKTGEIWIFGKDGQAALVDVPAGSSAGSPVWSPDGTKIAFWEAWNGGVHDLFVKPVSGAGRDQLVYKSPSNKFPTDWPHDGRSLIFGEYTPNSKGDIWSLNLSENRANPILSTINSEGYAALSPDGRWLAYQSDSGGHYEIYVQPWDNGSSGTKRVWKVSSAGGDLPRWRADSRELFYLAATGGVMSVQVHAAADDFEFDPPQLLFETRPVPRFWNLFDVAPDGQRFLVNLPLEWSNSSLITVMTNWTRKLENSAK
ncbi:MAG: protein kinase [Candidatus Sulfopaludibacter sp.]|nr:protein kinase [Candidatus Sulfopaludibacter sp.]